MSLKALITVLSSILILSACGEHGSGIRPKIDVGDRAPESQNLIVSNMDDWHQVSSMDRKVPLYRWRIADLMQQGKPFLVVFGTPQHCTMCVDQIVRVAVMEEMYGDRFAFIHVDGYRDNSVWVEWGLKGEPWTYFVDGNGEVTKIFPGQTELALLEQEVLRLLESQS